MKSILYFLFLAFSFNVFAETKECLIQDTFNDRPIEITFTVPTQQECPETLSCVLSPVPRSRIRDIEGDELLNNQWSNRFSDDI